MNISVDVIKKVLWEKFPDLPEWKINRIIEEMESLQDKYDDNFQAFVDRTL